METSPSVKVARGATYFIAQGLVDNTAALVYFAIAARLLPSVSDFGVLAAVTMVAGLFPIFASLALPTAVTKFVAEHIGKGDQDSAAGVFKKALKFGFVTGLAASSICYGLSSFLSTFLFGADSYAFLFKLLSVNVFLGFFSPFLLSTLQGLQRFREYAVIGIAQSALRNSLAVAFLLLGYGIAGILLGWLIGDLIAMLLALHATLPFLSKHSANHPLKPLLRYSLPLYGTSLLNYFSNSIDRYLILLLAGTFALGIYSPSIAAAGTVGIVTGSISGALFPVLSEIYGKFDEKAVSEASLRASRYMFLTFTPLAIGLAASAHPVISLFVGDRYLPAALPMAIIAIAMALTSGSVVVNNALLSLGLTRIFLLASIVAIVTDISVSLLLIGPFGNVGAAIARASLTGVLFLVPFHFLRRKVGHHLDKEAFIKSLASSLLMAIVVLLIQSVWMSKYLLPLYIAVGGIVYMLTLRLLGAIVKEDIELLRKLLPKRISFVASALKFIRPVISEKKYAHHK